MARFRKAKPATAQPHPEHRCKPESKIRQAAWVGLFLFSLAALAMMVRSGIEGRKYVRCTVDQSSVMIQYIRESSLSAAEERKANDLVREAYRHGDVAAQQAAIDEYFRVRKAADERRRSVPLPQLPETICGSQY